jgi:hypothetical protein
MAWTSKVAFAPSKMIDMVLLAHCRYPTVSPAVRLSIARAIDDFLAGKSSGEGLLHTLYNPVLDEPVPERLRAILRRDQPSASPKTRRKIVSTCCR